jgi:hypothetical protein
MADRSDCAGIRIRGTIVAGLARRDQCDGKGEMGDEVADGESECLWVDDRDLWCG